jgi:hypothetical protein
VCVAVARDGDYRIVRSLDNDLTQRLHGKMPKEELRQLTNLLEAAELRNSRGIMAVLSGGGLRLLQPAIAENSHP